MQSTLAIAEILVSILLILTVLLQVRGQGTGLFASAESTFRVRRGLERVLFQFTIILVVVFILISVLSVRMAIR
ncbi:MAG: preprotein translocase subunit SecG [Dehalococcoidia bacterium]